MVVSIVMGRRRAGALKWYCWEGEGFGFNHKFMIKVQKSSPSIMVTGTLWSMRVWVKDWLCKEKIYHP
jgi:hypothetical protein